MRQFHRSDIRVLGMLVTYAMSLHGKPHHPHNLESPQDNRTKREEDVTFQFFAVHVQTLSYMLDSQDRMSNEFPPDGPQNTPHPSNESIYVDHRALQFISNHVFFPLKVPQSSDQSRSNECALCETVCLVASQYHEHLPECDRGRWRVIMRMLENIRQVEEFDTMSAEVVQQQLTDMQVGDHVVYYVRAQNAAVVVRKVVQEYIFESFEVSAPAEKVMEATGKLLCYYPGPAIAVSRNIVEDVPFRAELSSFIALMSCDELDSVATTKKAGSTVVEKRDTPSPKYIMQLLTGILRGVGHPVDVERTCKRIHDDVLWKDAYLPWRRSPLWLVIRVALQTSLSRINDHSTYKWFMAYLMSRLLRLTVEQEFSSDLLYSFMAKVSRRLYKLRSSFPQFIVQGIREAVEATEGLLQRRFLDVQKRQAASPRWSPSELDLEVDTHLALPNSRAYIAKCLTKKYTAGAARTFVPSHVRRLRDTHNCDFRSFDVCALKAAFAAHGDIFVALADFEMLVQDRLDAWTTESIHEEWACTKVAECIECYAQAALKAYKGNPEDFSIMLLTIFELWVSLDKMVVMQCPLLKDYSPEVPPALLESLLLRTSVHLCRLSRVEDYLIGRQKRAFPGWSIFCDKVDNNSFSVRYFRTSPDLQALRQRIESDATATRKEKCAELQQSNSRYLSLTKDAASCPHLCTVNARGKRVQTRGYACMNCYLTREASRIKITPHEWPLPAATDEAQAVVFELRCPVPFATWRTSTYHILRDICQKEPPQHASPPMVLKKYDALTRYVTTMLRIPRVSVASSTKSFMQAHYNQVSIPAQDTSVLVNNGLRYQLYDTLQDEWVARPLQTYENVSECCQLLLPSKSAYRALEFAIRDTSHTPNQVLSGQSQCPVNLDQHEYVAYGLLRSGGRLQWLNILRELRARALSFEREEVHILLMQAAWQVGCRCDGVREWHVELTDQNYGLRLLAELHELLSSIEASWSNVTSARTIILLACRLLASTSHQDVRTLACNLLRNARRVTFQWMYQLLEKLADASDDAEVHELQLRVSTVAATCRSTFDVEWCDLKLLLASEEDVSVVVECAVHLHDNTPSASQDIPLDLSRLLARDRRLAHFLESALRYRIQSLPGGLDHPVATLWSEFQSNDHWKQISKPNDRWFTITSAYSTVHLDLLSGTLLVGGRPLGCLPSTIVHHPDYIRIFSKKVLRVIPSDMPGMEFATRAEIYGFHIHFSLSDRELIVRARRGSDLYELVPHNKFVGDLPALLVQPENYVHWLRQDSRDLTCAKIEFRPFQTLWTPSAANWHLHFSITGHSTMRQDDTLLLDNRSPSFVMVANRLRSLEYSEYLIITSTDGCLLATLPRFELAFSLNDGQLESRNWRGLIVDSNQSTGTMFGLSEQLVLTQTTALPLSVPERHVVIPVGNISFSSEGDHVLVQIETKSQVRVHYQKYRIDHDLGCLVGNVTLFSKLYQIYLHALTSYCLPDPLTGRTGTEEALNELRSARCMSFQKLGQDELAILSQIRALTPERRYYPQHLRVMQTVDWSDLNSLSQHTEFWRRAYSIMKHAESLSQIFYSDKAMDLLLSHALKKHPGDHHLQNRASCHSGVIHGCEYSGWDASDSDNLLYAPRDAPQDSTGEQGVATISALVHSWPSRLHTVPDLMQTVLSWQRPLSAANGITLSYSRDWLSPDLPRIWMSLYDWCRHSGANQRSQLLFVLSAMSLKSGMTELCRTILAFATVPQFRSLHPPRSLLQSYDLKDGFAPVVAKLSALARSFIVPYEQRTVNVDLSRLAPETEGQFVERCRTHYLRMSIAEADRLAAHLVLQWPCHTPSVPATFFACVRVGAFMASATLKFQSWYQNMQLQNHLHQIQLVLSQVHEPASPTNASSYLVPNPSFDNRRKHSLVDIVHLFKRTAPVLNVCNPAARLFEEIFGEEKMEHTEGAAGTGALKDLITEFRHSNGSPLQQQYGLSLELSRSILESQPAHTVPDMMTYSSESLLPYYARCRETYVKCTRTIQQFLGPTSEVEQIASMAGQWPRLSTRSLLRHLGVSFLHERLSTEWKTCLIIYARSFMQYQRARRLLDYLIHRQVEDFMKELDNNGFGVDIDDANFLKNPDWLLVQLEHHFMVRPLQLSVAGEMIGPSSGRNTVLQLNMGEGKSAVIAPLVASALADGRRLVRIVVLKSLASQMFHLLVGRLSGLANRRIFYLPFSRHVRADSQVVDRIRGLYEECVRERGILVAQPEHILSFKLMSIDHSGSSGDPQVSRMLVETQWWLDTVSRDVFDESDEMLNVEYQLVYTAGQQRTIEDSPYRWKVIQHTLSLVKNHAPGIQKHHPDQIEYLPGITGTYPRIRILQDDAWEELAFFVARDLIDNDTTLRYLPQKFIPAVFQFITRRDATSDMELLAQHCEGGGVWKKLLLLRGLLGHGLIRFVLKEKRWRVDYGLDLRRTLLAVPYRAKDVPSLRADFGHPDVAIALTCLSYYYGGLTDEQLNTCFELLLKSDDCETVYEAWVRGNDAVPTALRQFIGVNLEDSYQREHLLNPIFRRCHAVIDFYLSEVVFPREAKEFAEKLSASAWDLAESKTHVTTGFSGTNDNQYLLPSSITQSDPVGQRSTNARVLSYLLQPENRTYICVAERSNQKILSQDFLNLVVQQRPEVMVLLDVGAQMLDLENIELVRCWLSLAPHIPAAVFFDEEDELMVLTRMGTLEAFIVSPYSQRLDQCIVYLDDAHTRGTDLKLPRDSRAAVTLGPKITKDRLLQGCMRMRKLGHGQSVLFLAPLDVDHAIRGLAGEKETVETIDILRWAMVQTCAYLEHHLSHWAHQAVDYKKRSIAWDERKARSSIASGDGSLRITKSETNTLRMAWLSPDARPLEEMYGLSAGNSGKLSVDHAIFDDPDMRARFQLFGVSSVHDPRMDEEQEREVSEELEQEREVERVPAAQPDGHSLHPNVKRFVISGDMKSNPFSFASGFVPLFSSLNGISGYPGHSVWSSRLLATSDFATTLAKDSKQSKKAKRTRTKRPTEQPAPVANHALDCMAPVNWIISSRVSDYLVVYSAFEVNALLPEIRRSKVVCLHMYSPRVAYSMKPLDDLRFCCIPALPESWQPDMTDVCQLNLYAGQLYFSNRDMYLRLCAYLGICAEHRPEGARIQTDGFIEPEDRTKLMKSPCPFSESPLPFMKELIGLRRKGAGYRSTHMGKVLNSGYLTGEDFE